MKIFFYYIKELYIYAKYKIMLNLTLMVLLGMLEGIGILMLIPFLGIAGIIPLATPVPGNNYGLQELFNQLGTSLSLPVVLLIYTAIIFIQSYLRYYQSNLNMRIQQSLYSYLSIRLFKALAYAKWSFLISRRKSDITHSLTSELARISSGTQFFLQMTATAVLAVIQIGIAFLLSPALTSLVMLGGILFFCCMQSFVKKAKTMGLSISNHTRDLFFEVTEHLNGMKEVKSCGLETTQIENYDRLRKNIENNMVQFNRIQSGTDMLYKVSAAVFISIFFYCAIQFFNTKPQEFLLIIVIFARLWPRLSSFQMGLQQVVMMLPAFNSVIELEQECIKEREIYLAGKQISPMELKYGIELKNLSFSYHPGSCIYALKNVSLTIPTGSIAAIVGVSGSGKSTLADLITGLISAQEGELLLDGVPIGDINMQHWRSSIAYVSQDAFLFHASIIDNLRWANPHASNEEVCEALRMAAVDEFVSNMPDGLNTVVGDRGVRLSGGERQRIVLARALLRKPSLLILDEATSSLDAENEKRIYQVIASLQGKLTILLITHQLSTIQNADQIIVLEKGRIIEQGDYLHLTENQLSRLNSLAAI